MGMPWSGSGEHIMKTSRFRSIAMAVVCACALYIAWFSAAVLTFGGNPVQLLSFNEWIFDRYMLSIMILPFCLFAFIPRWWSTIPLWLSSLWVAFSPLFLTGVSANMWGRPLGFFGRNRAVEIAVIILLPTLVQIGSKVGKKDVPATHDKEEPFDIDDKNIRGSND
jgi:hypothetical protein